MNTLRQDIVEQLKEVKSNFKPKEATFFAKGVLFGLYMETGNAWLYISAMRARNIQDIINDMSESIAPDELPVSTLNTEPLPEPGES